MHCCGGCYHRAMILIRRLSDTVFFFFLFSLDLNGVYFVYDLILNKIKYQTQTSGVRGAVAPFITILWRLAYVSLPFTRKTENMQLKFIP